MSGPREAGRRVEPIEIIYLRMFLPKVFFLTCLCIPSTTHTCLLRGHPRSASDASTALAPAKSLHPTPTPWEELQIANAAPAGDASTAPTVSETDNSIHAIYCVHKITMLCVWTLLLLLGCKIYEICWARFHMGYRKIAEYLIFSMISINVYMLIKSNSLLNYVCVQ